MKLFSAAVFLYQAEGSHFRGGTYQVTPDNDAGTVKIDFTHAWRRFSDGFSGGCDQSKLQTWSSAVVTGNCVSGSSCQSNPMAYQLTFVDDQTPNTNDQYCYGDGSATMPIPAGPSRYGWSSCCWVTLTDDFGASLGSGGMEQFMQVNDWTNTSPTYRIPPIWLIMSGCDAQTISLKPVDADGDVVKCRWATQTEAGGSYNVPGRLPSLSLDENSCTVTYTGSLDQSTFGVKPIGLMIEDFDAAGNVRSSIPVQFLAKVWTPNINGRGVNYPDWFGQDEHEDHVDIPAYSGPDDTSGRRRRSLPVRNRRNTPSYCSAAPTFGEETPQDGDFFGMADDGTISFSLNAGSNTGGSIQSFSYQAPVGLGCTNVDSDGWIYCNWTLTEAQKKVEEFQFCFSATDTNGLVSDRRCLRLLTGAVPMGTVTNVLEMAAAMLTGDNGTFSVGDAQDYGCAGRGNFEPFKATYGHQVDQVDKQFYQWKKCVQCAMGTSWGEIPAYVYNADDDSCADSEAAGWPVCECDRDFIKTLATLSPDADHIGYDSDYCVRGAAGDAECCSYGQYKHSIYNPDVSCCDATNGVSDIGTC